MSDDVNKYELYLVGGAVRDELLGMPVYDRDWVVVGSTVTKMLKQGYRQVGKNFPVFLHPKTNEEYALARTERKIAPGHTGFEINSEDQVSLEDDLQRRDLTINAIAKDRYGNIIDPFNGRSDINYRVLRHVSDAFAEDPLRVLRVARFKAKYSKLEFSIADSTLELMKKLVLNGEIETLSPDRVWQETEKALALTKPSAYFLTLRECGALKCLFPQIDALFGVPQRADYHPEIDTGIHTMMVLDRAAELSNNCAVRFAALTHDLGKALTDKKLLPSHVGHEKAGIEPLKQLTKRYPVPNKLTKTALLCCEYHLKMHCLSELRAGTILKLIESLDGFRNAQIIEHFALVCQADAQGRKGSETKPYPQAQMLITLFNQVKTIGSAQIKDKSLRGAALGEAIKHARLNCIAIMLRESKQNFS